MQDICHPTEGRLLSHRELQEKHGVKTNFLEMLAIRLSIPLAWRQALSKDWVLPPIFLGGPYFVLLKVTLKTSQICLRKKPTTSHCQPKTLTTLLSTDGPKLHTSPPYRIKRNGTGSVGGLSSLQGKQSYRVFNSKFFTQIIPCRKYLCQIRIVEDEHCPQCGEVDDITHFFFLCPRIQTFWTSIRQWWSNKQTSTWTKSRPKRPFWEWMTLQAQAE